MSTQKLEARVHDLYGALNQSFIGCRAHLNPKGSDLRCGDKVSAWNWNLNEGVVQLCPLCSLKKQNSVMIDMLNRRNKGE